MSITEPCVGSEPPESGERVGPFRIGELLDGSFQIEAVIGVGGMGVVYDARDVHLGRPVAIKAPRLGMHKRALRREAEALAALRSPSFVTIHQFGTAHGVDYLVLERLFGITLDERLDELRCLGRPYPMHELVDVALAISNGLCAAHAAGFALRDVKPANVVLTGERVVMIDLGLATPDVIRDDEPLAGTPQYMAPEVILDDVKPGEGALVDLYGLGVLLFELATGRHPFARESMSDLLADAVCKPAPALTTLRDDVPNELASLVAELLAKKPADRPPSAEAVLWRLRALRERGAPGTPLAIPAACASSPRSVRSGSATSPSSAGRMLRSAS